VVVDLEGELGLERPERVVGQGGKVDDGVEAAKRLDGHVAQIHRHCGWVVGRRPEHAVREVPVVQSDDLVARRAQNRHHHGAEVTLMAGDQYSLAHALPPLTPYVQKS
jgi:hypothetical protein